MRILEINKFYYERRGTERHVLDVIRLFRDAGHEVVVFAMDDPRNVSRKYERYFVSAVGYNDDDSTPWQRLKGVGRLFWSFEARRKMKKLLDDFHPDIVHLHNAYHQLSLSFLSIIRKKKIPIVMTVHDYHLISPDKDAYHDSIGSRYWKFLFVRKYGIGKRILLVLKSYWERCFGFRNMIDAFIVPSEYVRAVLISAGIDERKIAVMPHFIPAQGSVAIPNLPEGDPYALYFGGIAEEKHVTELMAVFDDMRYPLILAGKLDMDMPKSELVRYVGEKNIRDLTKLISGARFIVSASRLPETFGLIVLEANAQGRPFFGYATGAFPEIVIDGRNGWLASDKDMFRHMISEFIRGERSVSDADSIRREAFARFGSKRYLDRFSELAEKLLRSRG